MNNMYPIVICLFWFFPESDYFRGDDGEKDSHFCVIMWRRKKTSVQNDENPSSDTSSKKSDVCMNCIKLMQENSQLKEQIAILSGEGKRKQYTIAPTLYTFYKNNVQKNRISRYLLL